MRYLIFDDNGDIWRINYALSEAKLQKMVEVDNHRIVDIVEEKEIYWNSEGWQPVRAINHYTKEEDNE